MKQHITQPQNSSDLEWWEYLVPYYNSYRALEHLSNKFAKPAKVAVEDAVRRNITLPFKKRLGLKTNAVILTERNFSNDFLQTLDSISLSQLDKQRPRWKEETAKGDTVRILVHGSDYTHNYGGTKVKRSLTDRLVNPLFQIETTLGSHIVEATQNDIIRYDVYDWDNRIHLDSATPYGYIRNVMGKIGTPQESPENEKIKIVIKSKRQK